MVDPRKFETDGSNTKTRLLVRGAAMAVTALVLGYIIARTKAVTAMAAISFLVRLFAAMLDPPVRWETGGLYTTYPTLKSPMKAFES